MQPIPWGDVAIIFALIALNGFFALSEMAIVRSRKPRLQALAKMGRAGAQTALSLASDPGKFLSTVQIGITLVGILAGAYSGATLGGPVAERLAAAGIAPTVAENLGFALVIALTTYFSLTVGELIPKQFALKWPESIAVLVAPVMLLLSRVGAPLVWLLDASTRLVFRLFGIDPEPDGHVTAEELHLVVAEAQTAGVIEESERQMISSVMRMADRPVRGLMTPRAEVDWIDINADEMQVRTRLSVSPHTRLAVAEGSVDNIVGVVQARDVLAALLDNRALDLRQLARRAPVVPDLMDAMDVLEVLRAADVPMALVHDEYGHFEGVVTPADLLAAIAGAFRSDLDAESDPPIVTRDDGSYLISGSYPADEMAERLGLDLPASRDYQTVAGFALAQLRHLPETGEKFSFARWTFEIVDMDGRKIDKLLAVQKKKKLADLDAG